VPKASSEVSKNSSNLPYVKHNVLSRIICAIIFCVPQSHNGHTKTPQKLGWLTTSVFFS